jgi:cobalamin transport system ATP-binding protein
VLRADGVHFAYGQTPILDGVSIEVEAGGFTAILGPNGSGKTTLLRLLAGTLKPARGRVTLDGVDTRTLPRALLARRMAVVPQETHLAFDYTVLEVVLMGRYPHLGAFEIEGPGDIAIARGALEATGTLPLEERTFATLSGGEKQRVIIAAALAQITSDAGPVRRPNVAGPASPVRRPDLSGPASPILLLDEPTAALDLGYQLEVASLLRDLQRRLPITVVISTHDLNFASSLSRTMVLLKDGRVLAAGLTEDVLTKERIRVLYGVDADVHRHAATGHLHVVPIARTRADGVRA